MLTGAELPKEKKGRSWDKYVQFILLKLVNQIGSPILVKKKKKKNPSTQSIFEELTTVLKTWPTTLSYICGRQPDEGLKAAAAAAKARQSCPTRCDPIDGSPLGSAVPGILQARTLEWVAISFEATIIVQFISYMFFIFTFIMYIYYL